MVEGRAFPDEDPFPDDMEPPELLMEATVRVLSDEGIQGLTLRKVAERAEKNRGLVHYYFESKADLLASLLDHILRGTNDLLGIDAADSPVERLWTAVRFHAYGPGGLDEAGRHYYGAILQLQALAAHDEQIRDRLYRNHQFMVDTIASIVQEGIDEGAFEPVDPEPMALFLIAAIDGARTLDLSFDTDSSRGSVLRMLEQYLSAALLTDS